MYGISSVGASTVSELYQLLASQSVSAASSGDTTLVAAMGDRSDTVEMSKPAELFSKLQQLQASDPEKLKQVLADIAEKLRDAASQKEGEQAQRLNELADRFEAASQDGDLSALQPPPPPMSGGVDAYQQNSQSDPLRQDGHRRPAMPHGADAMEDIWSSIMSEVDQALADL